MAGIWGRRPVVPEVTAAEVQQRLAAGEDLFVLDVREPYEYAAGHIAGSTLIPLGELSWHIADLPQDRSIVAVCHVGERSQLAAGLLRRAGFGQVTNLRGGMDAWEGAGLPVETGR